MDSIFEEVNVAHAFLLTYHDDHPNVPSLTTNITAGFPVTPFICDVCERTITERSQLSYDFLFKF